MDIIQRYGRWTRTMHGVSLRRRVRQFSLLVGRSAIEPMQSVEAGPVAVAPRRALTGAEQAAEAAVTFIGHSSFLLQFGGRTAVIDPNFARWLVVLKRQRKPGIAIENLPAIDVVMLTHAHMDHLHKRSLRKILQQTVDARGSAPVAVVPVGVGDLIAEMGFAKVIELNWWEQATVAGMEIIHTPAKHWGARVLRDRHRGFGGFVVRADGHSIYHAGDTAYFRGFKEIGERLHPEVALMPIGAYEPEHFRAVHASPEDALRGFVEMGARWLIPMHYGTFRLSHEPMEEPVPRLLAAARMAGVRGKIRVMKEGATEYFEAPAVDDAYRPAAVKKLV